MKRNTLSLLLLSLTAFGQSAIADPQYVNDTTEPKGWHFYEEEPEPEEEKKELPISPSPSMLSGPKPMSSKWLKSHFMDFVYEAIDNPTKVNIQRARYVQRAIMDKSSAFSEAWMQDVINNPYLDETQARPTSSYALSAKNEEKNHKESLAITKIAKQAGFWFFFESTCQYCKRQAPIVQRLMSQYGFEVNAISIDQAPMENGMFPNYTPDRKGVYKQLNVQRVPALFLVDNEGRFQAPISQGIVTESEIKRIMLIQAKQAQLITPEEFDAASAVESMDQLTSFSEIDEQKALNDPDYLVEILEGNLRAQQGL